MNDLAPLVTAAIAGAPVGFALLTADGRFLWVNDWLAAVAGIDPGAVAGNTTPDLFGETDPNLAAHFISVVRTGEAVGDIEFATVSATDGQRHVGKGTFVPVKDDHGAVVAVATIWWGIPDPGPAEQARRELEARFQTMADAAPVLIWMADTTGACDWFNAGWVAFTGRPMEESVGEGWVDLIHPDDRERVVTDYFAAFERRERFELEYRLRRHDGEHRWILDWAVPRFTPDGTFAGYIGSCVDIEDRRAAEAAERADRLAAEQTALRLARLQAVTAAFAETHTPESVFEVVVAEALVAPGADAGSVSLLADDGRTIEVVRAAGYPEELLERFRTFPVDADLPIARTIRTGEAVYLSGDEGTEDFDAYRVAAAPGDNQAAATIPLVVWGRTIGALALSFRERQPFDAEQRAFLGSLARQCATALERARLFAAESEARQAAEVAHVRLVFLAEASQVIASTLDRAEVLRRVVDLAVPRLADQAAAYLPEGDRLERVVLVPGGARVDDLVAAPSVAFDAHSGVAAAFQGRPAVCEHGVVVPITSRGATLGVLAFAREELAGDDVAVAVELGARVGVALENAGLYEQEHTVAEALQRAVLPVRLPDVAGVELAARYIPSSPGREVGGDWYDAFPLRDGRLGIAVGDVAGHGLRAAATMGQLRNALRAYAVDGEPPGRVLDRLGALLADEGEEAFATAIYAIDDSATGLLRWANAGHPPPAWLGERTGFVDGPVGTVLGTAEEPYEEAELVLPPGQGLLLYTDGLVERRGEHLADGMARLAAAVPPGGGGGLDALCEQVVTEVLGDTARGDDVCLLAVRRAR